MTKFKVGDKVRLIKNSAGGEWDPGYIGFITKVHVDSYEVDGDKTESGWYIETDLELAGNEGDNVNSPEHYNNGTIECIDYIESFLTREEFIGYLRGNIAKYLHRYKYKNGVEDLKKADWYKAKLNKAEGIE